MFHFAISICDTTDRYARASHIRADARRSVELREMVNPIVHSTPMMDLLVQIATAHKLTASSYTLQAIGERGLVLPHHPNTPIGALDALQVSSSVSCARRQCVVRFVDVILSRKVRCDFSVRLDAFDTNK